MSQFTPRSIRLTGTVALAGAADQVFELFSPLGEKRWVPEWDPELLHPPGVAWEAGQIFRTREERGDAIWVVTRLDRAGHVVEYHRVEPGRYVAHIEVRCAPRGPCATEAAVAYEFIGLSDGGNAEIAAMSQDAYAQKMARWTRWIDEALTRRAP